ncbi:SDR family NAD(P)-dependent oxidoreductase [Pseudonocardia broussonetiae]|uniref:SDR family NAD(P)-dependent oxidoreductase n=1 Tax=Pseudonocardia broussonetiae TaxID=2736640 RepID=A0A6M6JLG8_9PSEU|nr:SDR family NAD(P)-dependent oxidoreductase [Pseudonocardia broussonetiae]QJY48043.1 SDR family NAD(P)-dependent oxidoreductase [Pseudonocardia broussonetiae]
MGVLDGRVAIITGAGRGIGASIARLYVKQGAKVVVNDLGSAGDGTGADSGPAQTVAEQLNEEAGATVAVADGGDIAEVETGDRLLQTALDHFGKLDVLVNAAGILRDRMIFNLAPADWDAVIRVHLRGHYSTIRPASAHWRAQRNPDGHYRIINFTSDSGLHGSPGQPNYAAAKMGVVGLTQSLANGLARYGVTANAIAPGAATRLTAAIPDDKRVAVREDGPEEDARRSPDNIAAVVAHIGSEQTDWLSGRTISSSGFHVGLYNVPEEIASFDGRSPWEVEDLGAAFESTFRALADGLAPTPFAIQTAR